MYRLATLLVAGAVAAAALTVYAQQPADPGDDPPVLKKKGTPEIGDPPAPPAGDKDKDKDKDRKPADAPKPGDDKTGAADKPPRPDPDEVLKGVAKSMHAAEDRLANKEFGDPTRQAQEDALKGLDSLIDLAENPPDDQDNNMDNASSSSDSKQGDSQSSSGASKQQGSKSGSSGSSGSPPGSSSSSKSGKGRRGSKGSRTSKGGQQPGGGSSSSGQQPMGSQGDPQDQDMAGAQGGHDGKNGNGNGGGGKTGQTAEDKNADLYKNVWGHLPETLRAEMNAYSNTKGFMPEYESLISRYYSTIAEQGRRKGE